MCMVYQNCKNEFEFLWEFLDLDYCTCTVLCIITSIIDYYALLSIFEKEFLFKVLPYFNFITEIPTSVGKDQKKIRGCHATVVITPSLLPLSLSLLSFASMPPSFPLPYNWRRAVIFYSLATWKWLGGWIISYKSGEPTPSLSKVQWRKFRNSEKWYFIIARFLWWNGQMQFHSIS